MPLYEFRDKETGNLFEITLRISEYDEYMKNNPNVERYHAGVPSIGDPIKLGFRKPDDAFRDKLKDIKSKHRRSTINTF